MEPYLRSIEPPITIVRGWPAQLLSPGRMERGPGAAGGARCGGGRCGLLSRAFARCPGGSDASDDDYDGGSSECWSSEDYNDDQGSSGAGDEAGSSAGGACSCGSSQPVPIPPFKEPKQRAWAVARYHLQQLAAHQARRASPGAARAAGPQSGWPQPQQHQPRQPQQARHAAGAYPGGQAAPKDVPPR